MIHSPIDICLSPVEDVQVCIPPDEIGIFGQATGYEEVWPRGRNALAVRRTGWLRLYDFQTDAGSASMFVPNGAGSVEWHLGWEMEFPDSHYVMVLPLGEPISGLEVPVGVLDHRTVQRINRESGFSIAVRPRRRVRLARGQAFARVILLHPDSVRAKVESPTDEPSEE